MIRSCRKIAVWAAVLTMTLQLGLGISTFAAMTYVMSIGPPRDRQGFFEQQDAWYGHVEADAKAGRGRAQVPGLIAMMDTAGRTEDAAQLVGIIGNEAVDAVPSLIRHLNDSDFWTRLACIRALGDIGPDASSAVPALIKLLSDPYWAIVENATVSLEEIGPKAQAACPTLEKILLEPKDSDRYASVAVACRVALAHLTGKPGRHVMALLAMLKEKDDDKNENYPALEATEGLGELTPASKIALPEICAELGDLKLWSITRAEAAKDIEIFDDPLAVPFLQKSISEDPDGSVRGAAIDALERIEGLKAHADVLRHESAERQYREMHRFWWLRFL